MMYWMWLQGSGWKLKREDGTTVGRIERNDGAFVVYLGSTTRVCAFDTLDEAKRHLMKCVAAPFVEVE